MWASQLALVVKNHPANAGDMRQGFDPWVRKILWRRVWQPTPVSLPGESHGQRSLVGYSPWACRVGHNLVTKPSPPNNSYLSDQGSPEHADTTLSVSKNSVLKYFFMFFSNMLCSSYLILLQLSLKTLGSFFNQLDIFSTVLSDSE